MGILKGIMTPVKAMAAIWLPVSILVTVVALASALDGLVPGLVEWEGPFAQALSLYREYMAMIFGPIGGQVTEASGITVPKQTGDAIMAYFAAASAFTLAGTTLRARESFWQGVQSTFASMTFPGALLYFGGEALRRRVVTSFATEHTRLFIGYIALVAAGFGAAWYFNGQLAAA